MDDSYELRYLPMFYDDVTEKIDYIINVLQNPDAAKNLLDDIEEKILERQPFAESFEPYHSTKDRAHPYYRIYVHNFIVFYVVIREQGTSPIMEVRRFLYNRQAHTGII